MKRFVFLFLMVFAVLSLMLAADQAQAGGIRPRVVIVDSRPTVFFSTIRTYDPFAVRSFSSFGGYGGVAIFGAPPYVPQPRVFVDRFGNVTTVDQFGNILSIR